MCFEVGFDRADFAVLQPRVRGERRPGSGDTHRPGAERGVLDAMAQQFVRKLCVGEFQTRGSLHGSVTLLEDTGVDVDRALVVHGRGHARGQCTDGQFIGSDRRGPLVRLPVGVGANTDGRSGQTQPLYPGFGTRQEQADGSLELEPQRFGAFDGERLELPVEDAL